MRENVWWGHYSGRILKLIDLYWRKVIGNKSPYSLSDRDRKKVFNYVCKKVYPKVRNFYSTFGEQRTLACFGSHILYNCIYNKTIDQITERWRYEYKSNSKF